MSRVPAVLFAGLLLAVPFTVPAQSRDGGKVEKKLYCWNEGKERICSDSLPADAVNHAREEFNAKSGLRNAQVQRALTDEERAAASTVAQQQQLDLMAEQTRQRTEQAMLSTYGSEDDLRRVFAERQEVLDNNLKTAEYNVTSLRESLVRCCRPPVTANWPVARWPTSRPRRSASGIYNCSRSNACRPGSCSSSRR